MCLGTHREVKVLLENVISDSVNFTKGTTVTAMDVVWVLKRLVSTRLQWINRYVCCKILTSGLHDASLYISCLGNISYGSQNIGLNNMLLMIILMYLAYFSQDILATDIFIWQPYVIVVKSQQMPTKVNSVVAQVNCAVGDTTSCAICHLCVLNQCLLSFLATYPQVTPGHRFSHQHTSTL